VRGEFYSSQPMHGSKGVLSTIHFHKSNSSRWNSLLFLKKKTWHFISKKNKLKTNLSRRQVNWQNRPERLKVSPQIVLRWVTNVANKTGFKIKIIGFFGKNSIILINKNTYSVVTVTPAWVTNPWLICWSWLQLEWNTKQISYLTHIFLSKVSS
jgi:hypothetical protein